MGDLSLSQSLGGLRIANPDDEDPNASPSPPPPAAAPARQHHAVSHSTASTITPLHQSSNLLGNISHESSPRESGLGFDPASYTLQEPAMPPSLSSEYGTQSAPYSAGGQLPRDMQQPTSGVYSHHNSSSTSAFSNYDYRSDLNSNDVTRRSSRSSQQPLGMPSAAQVSHVHRQLSQHSSGGPGPMPPRRNSRRSRAPTGASDAGRLGSTPQSSEAWRDRGAAVGTKVETDAAGQTVLRTVRKGVKDFSFGGTLGEGSYSTVVSATDRQTLKEYAIKVLDKRHIIKEKKVKYVNIERDTLNRLTEHPGIVRLYYTFQDERSLYFVLDLASGGELLGVLKKLGSFDVDCTRFYAAQILDSVAYMHSRGVIHRDLKPENVLLDRDMHVKVTDFGTAKILAKPTRTNGGDDTANEITDTENDRAKSFVGTAEYVSPELLRDKSACKASDLWAFGCIVFQLLAGRPPFKAANEYLTFQKILGLDYTFPSGFPEDARDLVERLLVLDPAARLSIEHIRNHPFFDGITWGRGLWRQKAPRLRAYIPPPAAPAAPIKLNGNSDNQAHAAAAHALSQAKQGPPRPQLRNITDLPPPSQLDIDWSPVLVHNNERILKLGNLIVSTTAQPHPAPGSKNADPGTPTEKPKFSRFFSGNTVKRRERLILITSHARLIVAAAGGNEKKAKMDISFAALSTSWNDYVDAKGLTGWMLDTKDKHFTFEDPRATTADPAGSKFCTQEWLEAMEQAKEIFLSNQQQSATTSYSASSMLNGLNGNSMPSSADSIGDTIAPLGGGHHLRQTLRKDSGDSSSLDKGRKRFSKRHSKSGLAAVF